VVQKFKNHMNEVCCFSVHIPIHFQLMVLNYSADFEIYSVLPSLTLNHCCLGLSQKRLGCLSFVLPERSKNAAFFEQFINKLSAHLWPCHNCAARHIQKTRCVRNQGRDTNFEVNNCSSLIYSHILYKSCVLTAHSPYSDLTKSMNLSCGH
jgi:hypothetical protein